MKSSASPATAKKGPEIVKRFKYQWRQVPRCSENSHIMPALDKFGADGWEVFQVQESYSKEDKEFYGVWMRREI